MSTKKIWALFGAIAIAGSGIYATGCSSDDSNSGNPKPQPHDASTQGDSSTGGNDGGTGSDTGTQNDSGNPNCQSDATTCNSCADPKQDPLNACSPATGNCIHFDNSRVPKNVPSP